MDSVHKLERIVGEWYENVPHLPKNGQEWLADNIWWLSAVGAILGVLALLALIPIALFAFGLTAVANLTMMGGYGYGYIYSGLAWLSVLVSLVTLILYVTLTGMAIVPLRARHKKGWNFLFMALIIDVISAVVNLILSFNIGGLIWSAIGVAIGGYLLFEIRSVFLGTKTKEELKKAVVKKS